MNPLASSQTIPKQRNMIGKTGRGCAYSMPNKLAKNRERFLLRSLPHSCSEPPLFLSIKRMVFLQTFVGSAQRMFAVTKLKLVKSLH